MKRVSMWIQLSIGGSLFLGLIFILMGLFVPGALNFNQAASGGEAIPTADMKKKSEPLLQQLRASIERPEVPKGPILGHRVFVSRTLLFLPKQKESVQAMSDDLITADGINVGWKIKHGLDLEDPNVAENDDDSDGFSNKEEFDKGTDPGDAGSSPSRWIKLRVASVESKTVSIAFSGKSGDRFTLRFTVAGKRKEESVLVGDKIWLAVTTKGVEVVKNEPPKTESKETLSCPHPIPFMIKGYQADRGKRMNDKTKTENDYDDSFLELERQDGVSGLIKIFIDVSGEKSRAIDLSVGDIRLVSLVPGEGEMGPFRIGQSFPYAGKEFVIRDAGADKVTLWIKADGEEVILRPKTP